MVEERFLPTPDKLSELLEVHTVSELSETFEKTLLGPLDSFLEHSGKRFRTKLLQLSFSIEGKRSSETVPSSRCDHASEILEAIHAASMIIDDIEDQSADRRGAPALHLKVGTAVALNAGNWLYFWPLWKLREWDLPPEIELRTYRLCTDALLKAHCGQAIDVGDVLGEIKQSKIRAISMASLELKTGALVGLATELGAVLSGSSPQRCQAWRTFGVQFGVALQMFDDLGNFASEKMGVKRYEDLKLRRPGWVWSIAADSPPPVFARFYACIDKLPDDGPLQVWAQEFGLVARARAEALDHLNKSIENLTTSLGLNETEALDELANQLKVAYV